MPLTIMASRKLGQSQHVQHDGNAMNSAPGQQLHVTFNCLLQAIWSKILQIKRCNWHVQDLASMPPALACHYAAVVHMRMGLSKETLHGLAWLLVWGPQGMLLRVMLPAC